MASIVHCCVDMSVALSGGEMVLEYVPKFREYGIRILDGGASHLEISFCPWCGSKLPETRRDAWFDELESRKLDPGDPKLPAEFLSEEWWQMRRL